MRIVVIGGTGLIGYKVVAEIDQHGHEAMPASPATGVDTLTGEGLFHVLKGAEVVVDVSNAPGSFADRAIDFFERSSRNLLAAEAKAGVRHHVALSIVGSERLTESDYLRGKVIQEDLVKSSSIPYSIVRATQIFEFMESIAADATAGSAVRLPPALIQPIAAGDAASAVARVAMGSPLNGIVEVAGPEQFSLDELVRRQLEAHDDPREVISDSEARYYGVTPGERTLLPGGHAWIAETRFEDWSGQPTAAR
jgi:uncharacterized protein YbjT (DUF2867 family)